MMRHLAYLLLLSSIAIATPARAQDEGGEEEQKTQFTVTPPIYKKLSEAHELISKNSFDKAMSILQGLMEKRGLNDHERSLTLQAISHIYAARDKYADAAKTLEQCLALNALPPATLLQSRYNLGQLYLALNQFDKAIATFTTWLAQVQNPTPAALYTIAVAYTQAKQPKAAIGYVERAVKSSNNPADGWLQLLLALQFELKQYAAATTTLKTLLARNPKKKAYWLQLASAYEEIGDANKALAVMELAYRAGVLERPEEYVNFVQRLIAQGAPGKGARILRDLMKDGRVPQSFENLKLLANAWLNARERDQALDALEKMAKSDSTGMTQLRMAQVTMEMERWEDATRSLRGAIGKGGLDNPGQAQLMLGTVLVNQKKFDAAKQAFLEAKKYPQVEASATKWLHFVEKQK